MGNGESLGEWSGRTECFRVNKDAYQLTTIIVNFRVTFKNDKFTISFWDDIKSEKKIFNICDKMDNIMQTILGRPFYDFRLVSFFADNPGVMYAISSTINNYNKSLIRKKLEKKIQSSGVIGIIIDYIFADKRIDTEHKEQG